jgi:two-component system, NarL family, sensor histidine kinase UhpB
MGESSSRSKWAHELPWRDVAIVIGVTGLSIAISARFDLNEKLYTLTRRWERFQIDELYMGMLVLLVCLMWLSWRRYRHACKEVRARQIAEARLAGALLENRELAQENLRIEETERKHLARELHDEFGQYLNAIKLDAMSIRETGGDTQAIVNASIAIIRSADHVHGVVRDMIARLRPAGLDELGLVAAIWSSCISQSPTMAAAWKRPS